MKNAEHLCIDFESGALGEACYYGHLEVVKYLHTEFGLTADDARTLHDEALTYACENGHLEVVKYLHRGFKLTKQDAQYYNNEALKFACENGHANVVKYLATGFKLTKEDAIDGYALDYAGDHIDVICVLWKYYHLEAAKKKCKKEYVKFLKDLN